MLEKFAKGIKENKKRIAYFGLGIIGIVWVVIGVCAIVHVVGISKKGTNVVAEGSEANSETFINLEHGEALIIGKTTEEKDNHIEEETGSVENSEASSETVSEEEMSTGQEGGEEETVEVPQEPNQESISEQTQDNYQNEQGSITDNYGNRDTEARWLYRNSRASDIIPQDMKEYLDTLLWDWTEGKYTANEVALILLDYLEEQNIREWYPDYTGAMCDGPRRYLERDLAVSSNGDAYINGLNSKYSFFATYFTGTYTEYGDAICFEWCMSF